MTEKRRFRRYKKETVFTLRHAKIPYEARMVDYSLEGMRASVTGRAELKKGDTVHVESESPWITTEGTVVRVERAASEWLIGVRNTGALKGCIQDFRFSDTLFGLTSGQKNGILRVEIGDVTKKVYIKGGDIIFSSSNHEKDHLGALLVREGKITEEQLRHFQDEADKNRVRLGKVLFNQGVMTPQEIWKAVRKQIEGIILKLFLLEEGTFVFDEMESLPTEELITLKLSPADMIYHGIKEIKNTRRILQELPPMDSVLHLTSDPFYLFQDVKPDPAGLKIASYIDNTSSIRDIIRTSLIGEEEALKTILALLSCRLIVAKPQKAERQSAAQETLKEVLESRVDPELKAMIEKMYADHERLGYYAVLEVSENTPPPDIKKAYFRAAKRFHPDTHFHLEDDSLKYKLSHIFSYINRAYYTLSNPARKAAYDRSLNIKPSKGAAKQDMAKEYFNKGAALFGMKRYMEAEPLLRKALYLDDLKAEYHYCHGMCLLHQEKYHEAKKSLERAISLAPFNADYVRDLGRLFIKLGFHTRAKGLLDKALKMSMDGRTSTNT